MKTSLLAILLPMLAVFSTNAQTLSGKEIFANNCKACHSIGEGDVVGPDLAGLTERRDAEWVKSFITNSQKMVQEGDEAAVEVFNKYNKIAMPAHNFSDEELTSLVSYLDEAGKEALAAKEEPVIEEPATKEPAVAVASGPTVFEQLILGILVVAVALLSAVAIYLYRFLKV